MQVRFDGGPLSDNNESGVENFSGKFAVGKIVASDASRSHVEAHEL
jgi:hypothetical protein